MEDSAELAPYLLDAVEAGDVVIIERSPASRTGPLAHAMRVRNPLAGG
jgi:hypothetical protein